MEKERVIAYRIIQGVLEGGASLRLSFKAYTNDNIKVSFLRELTYGTIRNKLYIDYLIELATEKRIANISKRIRNIIRLAVYQIEFMNIQSYAILNEAVELCKLISPKDQKFITWILREYLRNKKPFDCKHIKNNLEKLSIKYSFPIHFVEYIYKRRGFEQTEQLLAFYNKHDKVYVYNLKTSEIQLSDNNELQEDEYIISPVYIDMFKSMLSDLNIKGYIYDCCAAPGGKTILLKNLFKDAIIFANDIDNERMNCMKENIKRMNIPDIHFFNEDFLNFDINRVFDMVLIDVPCTATGTINKNPDIKYNYRKKIKSLLQLQKDFINRADIFVKEGGYLFYTTCSILEEENQLIIKNFLERNPNYELYDQYFTYGNPYNGSYGSLLYKKEV